MTRPLLSLFILMTTLNSSAQTTSLEEVLAAVDRMGAAQRATSSLASTGRPTPTAPRAETICSCGIRTTRATPEELARWERAGFTQAEVTTLDLRDSSTLATRAPYEVDITAVVYRGSDWDPERVKRLLPIVSDIYGQCGVRIRTVKLVHANPAYRELDYSSDNEGYASGAIPDGSPKPRLFFARNNVGPGAPAHAYPRYVCHWRSNCETAWFSQKTITVDHRIVRNDPIAFSVAHELGHILVDTESDEGSSPNLMQHTAGLLGTALTPAQCQRVRANRNVRPVAR